MFTNTRCGLSFSGNESPINISVLYYFSTYPGPHFVTHSGHASSPYPNTNIKTIQKKDCIARSSQAFTRNGIQLPVTLCMVLILLIVCNAPGKKAWNLPDHMNNLFKGKITLGRFSSNGVDKSTAQTLLPEVFQRHETGNVSRCYPGSWILLKAKRQLY